MPDAIVTAQHVPLGLTAEQWAAVAGLVIIGAGSSKMNIDTVPEPLLQRAQALPQVWLEHRMARRVVIRLDPAK